MKIKQISGRLVGFASFLLLSVTSFGQDDCSSPIGVADLTGTVCETSAPSNTNFLGGACTEGNNDTWFSFVAQGPTATINVSSTIGNFNPEFMVVSGNPASTCAGYTLESCTDANGNYNSINSATTPLNIGETYWIVVSSGNNTSSGIISVCVDNPAPGACQGNEDCSTPQALALNAAGGAAACVTDCNTGASAGPDFAGNNCYDLPNETVWYTITTDATTTSLDINLTSTDLSDPEFTLFTTANCSTYSIIDCTEGSGGSASSTGVAVSPNTTYLIAVSDVTGDEGDFDLCVTQIAPASGSCVDNQDCSTPEVLALNPSGGAATCVVDCNTGASSGPDFTGNNCQDFPNETVWYSFTTDANAATVDINLTSGDLSDPEFTLFTTADCLSYLTIYCNEGSGGSAVGSFIGITANTTYLIAVSDATGDEGDFNLCVTQNPDNSACNTDNTLAVTGTSMGSPLTGPFNAGEVVSFCYTINTFTTGLPSDPQGCNYLQGIVPTFGSCWDPVSFDAQGMPIIQPTPLATVGVIPPCPPGPPCFYNACSGTTAGTWQWFADGAVQYNLATPNPLGYTTGDAIGAGWFFLTSYNSPAGNCFSQETDPNSSYGDNDFPQCADLSGWTVCFDLQVKSSAACGAGETDCSVSIKTFADGEIGVWNNIGCTADLPNTSPNTMNCALPVELLSLTGEYIDKSVLIDWTTLSEENTSHFIINHMGETGPTKEVGTVKATGDSQEDVDYRFVHDTPHPGVNYYNLQAVDFDGTTKDHGYISVNAKFGYVHYDQGAQEIVLAYDSDVEIYTMDGSLIQTSKGSKRIKFEPKGIFLIRDLSTGIIERIVTY